MRPLPLLATLIVLVAATADLRAETHRFAPVTFHGSFARSHAPVLRIASGDRVVTAILDDLGADAQGKTVAAAPNPHTGPFFIEGAEPGDLLVVTLDALEPNRTTGWSTSVMSPLAADPAALSRRQDPRRLPWTIDAAAGVVRFDLQTLGGRTDWSERFERPVLELPLRPTLGSIAVAPADDTAIATTASGPFGGDMSAAGLTAGTRVMLHVFQPGALLFLGHGHARQGDGVVTGTGIETSLDVQFSVEVVKKKAWPHSTVVRPSTVVGEFAMAWPRVETDEYLMTVGSADAFLPALQFATLELHHWLDDDFGFSEQAVSLFLGQAVEYEIGGLAETSFTVVAKVRKTHLPRPAEPLATAVP